MFQSVGIWFTLKITRYLGGKVIIICQIIVDISLTFVVAGTFSFYSDIGCTYIIGYKVKWFVVKRLFRGFVVLIL
jgi:hypothetical protein